MDLPQLIIPTVTSAVVNGALYAIWWVAVARRLNAEEARRNSLHGEVKELREQRIVAIENRLTVQHRSKDQLEAAIREELRTKVDDRTLRTEFVHAREALEATNGRLEKAEEKIATIATTTASTAAVVELIASRMNITLPGRKSPAD